MLPPKLNAHSVTYPKLLPPLTPSTGSNTYISTSSKEISTSTFGRRSRKRKPGFDVVLGEKEAYAILRGVSDADKRVATQITGRYLGRNDTATASVSLVSPDRKKLLWSGEAGDRSLLVGAFTRGGERKVTSRRVKQLKEAFEAK